MKAGLAKVMSEQRVAAEGEVLLLSDTDNGKFEVDQGI